MFYKRLIWICLNYMSHIFPSGIIITCHSIRLENLISLWLHVSSILPLTSTFQNADYFLIRKLPNLFSLNKQFETNCFNNRRGCWAFGLRQIISFSQRCKTYIYFPWKGSPFAPTTCVLEHSVTQSKFVFWSKHKYLSPWTGFHSIKKKLQTFTRAPTHIHPEYQMVGCFAWSKFNLGYIDMALVSHSHSITIILILLTATTFIYTEILIPFITNVHVPNRTVYQNLYEMIKKS